MADKDQNIVRELVEWYSVAAVCNALLGEVRYALLGVLHAFC